MRYLGMTFGNVNVTFGTAFWGQNYFMAKLFYPSV
jgi:hypothetical protein